MTSSRSRIASHNASNSRAGAGPQSFGRRSALSARRSSATSPGLARELSGALEVGLSLCGAAEEEATRPDGPVGEGERREVVGRSSSDTSSTARPGRVLGARRRVARVARSPSSSWARISVERSPAASAAAERRSQCLVGRARTRRAACSACPSDAERRARRGVVGARAGRRRGGEARSPPGRSARSYAARPAARSLCAAASASSRCSPSGPSWPRYSCACSRWKATTSSCSADQVRRPSTRASRRSARAALRGASLSTGAIGRVTDQYVVEAEHRLVDPVGALGLDELLAGAASRGVPVDAAPHRLLATAGATAPR